MSIDVDQAALSLAVRNTWEQLAEIIANTKSLEAKAREEPTLLDDPWVKAHTRFAFIFKDELGAAETLYEALARDVRIPTEQLVPAYDAERKLLEIVTSALQRLETNGPSVVVPVAGPGGRAPVAQSSTIAVQ